MRVPTAATPVYKDECALCSHSLRHPEGLFVCMTCFVGYCPAHVDTHVHRSQHSMFTNLQQLPPIEPEVAVTDINQLGVVAPPTFESALCCGVCHQQYHKDTVEAVGLAAPSFHGIVSANSAGTQAAIDADAAQTHKVLCPHLQTMVQTPSARFGPGRPPQGTETCAACDVSLNCWMCVTCGEIGCPRKEAGGNQHAILHYMMSGHSVVLKLGTVTATTGDLYCYACDNEVRDEQFAAHMATFGIDIHTAVKTAKSLGEMQYDLSSRHDFNKITEAGTALVPAYGPMKTGLHNFGNTCYMNSVVQCLLPIFAKRFVGTAHRDGCNAANPLDCCSCQFEKLLTDMHSGVYSVAPVEPAAGTAAVVNGITPRAFKKVFANKHSLFSTAEQQDAQEYLLFLLKEIHRRVCGAGGNPQSMDVTQDPTLLFDFVVEERRACAKCQAVEYKHRGETTLQLGVPVVPPPPIEPGSQLTAEELEARRPSTTLDACLDAFLAQGGIECRCAQCNEPTTYLTTQRLATFPDVLVINPRRDYFDPVTLTAKKLDVNIEVPRVIQLGRAKASGPQLGEVLMKPSSSSSNGRGGGATGSTATAEVDQESLAMVVSMGIDVDMARWALASCSNNVERAIDFVFSHPEGPPSSTEGNAAGEPDPLPPPTAMTAPTDGAATYELRMMISHMGASATTGHYVAHVRDEATGDWYLYNDEKVAVSQSPPFQLASVYFFVRTARATSES